MTIGVINKITDKEMTAIEQVFMPNGCLQVVKVEDAMQFTQEHLTNFCLKHGLYGIITDEVIEEIEAEIGDMSAIEIGSGCGLLGRALGIKATDNREKEEPAIIDYHAQFNQPIAPYGDNVEKLDAVDAIIKYKPEVVVACWVTPPKLPDGITSDQWKRAMKKAKSMGEYFRIGVHEEEFYKLGIKKYIKIGNLNTAGKDKILTQPYWDVEEIDSPTFVSRSMSTENNRIWILTRK